MTTCSALFVFAALSAAACSQEATEPAADAGPFAAWDMAGRKAAFAGAFVTPGRFVLGSWVAWEVAGDKIKEWDGQKEKTFDLVVKSPCEADIVEKSDGESSSTTTHYTVKDGQLIMGLGGAGSRKGPEAVACISNAVVTLEANGTCTQWEESMFDKGKYEAKPGTCGFAKEGEKEVFKATINGSETGLLVDGDALMTEQLKATHSEKIADYAAARGLILGLWPLQYDFEGASAASAAADAGSGTCLFSENLKCTEWRGHIAPKRAACEMFGNWTAEPCPMKATSVGECTIVDGDITGTVYYGGIANAAFAENDCSLFHGTYRPREQPDAAASATPLASKKK